MHHFLASFSGYNQVCMASKSLEHHAHHKVEMIVAILLMVGLKTSPVNFQWIIVEIFEPFMQAFLEAFVVLGRQSTLKTLNASSEKMLQQWQINSCVLLPPTTQTHNLNWWAILRVGIVLISVPILMVFTSHKLGWIEGVNGSSRTSPWVLFMHSDIPPIGDHS